MTILHFCGDAYSIILGPSLSQRLLQSHCVQHKTIVEAASDIVHLQERIKTKMRNNRNKYELEEKLQIHDIPWNYYPTTNNAS